MSAGIVRPLKTEELQGLSHLISNTLLISNSSDYSLEDIRRLRQIYTVDGVRTMMRRGRVWVFDSGGAIRGVLALEGPAIQAFFVAPDAQGQGIGRRLFRVAVEWAKRMDRDALEVTASLTAQPFYERLGFVVMGRGGTPITGPTVRMRYEV